MDNKKPEKSNNNLNLKQNIDARLNDDTIEFNNIILGNPIKETTLHKQKTFDDRIKDKYLNVNRIYNKFLEDVLASN